ncbi:glycine cleavage system protein H [Candidatus Bathyarchaeota archaeon]|nr:MAG: glycine cleavage system protein H [Candidatus Bathyarchaeota archaeon]
MHEVVFADLPEVGSSITQNEPYGTLESVKAVSDLIAPISGTVVEVNQSVLDNPGLINEDPYGEGWLIVVSPSNLEAELQNLMDFNAAVDWHKELASGG